MNAEAAGRILDITRLVSRVGRGPLTGIDRVELAYLAQFSAGTDPLFLLIGTPAGAVVLPGTASSAVRRLLDWPEGRRPPGLRIAGALVPRLAALAELRGLAVASGRSGAALRRLLPRGGTYFNVGHANLAALAPLGAAGFRRVVMVHDTIPLDFPQFARDPARFRRRLALVARHADQVVCPSGAAMQDVARWCGNLGRVPPILVAPLGVVAAAPGTIPDGLGRYRDGFMAIGTVEPRKNHGLLLDVWEQLSRDTADVPPLLIVGSRGWKNADLLRRIDRLDPEGPVRMVSGLGDGAVSALVAGARAVLMPSLAEGFGLPAVEAAAAGTPVVCAPLPVYREILGDYPVYVDPADLYSWVETIRKLAEQRGRRPTLAGDLVIPTWENHFNLVSDMA